ncbi:MAG TPA: BamA/TamA family outer membrane protein, partial [Candidatus Nanopelagicales bacterium]|nr:BamA/TamA family outer membrane protein [Candidatus Nanopelagicales bacterium]
VEDVTEGETENIVGYREYAGAIGLERPFLGNDALNVGVFYNLQLNDPFSYNRDAPPAGFRRLLLPYLQSVLTLDLRRDAGGKPTRIDPSSGVWMSLDAELAGYVFGDADDVRLQPEFRAYVPISRRVTLAFRLLFGLLFPRNYGQAFARQEECLASPEGSPERDACEQLLASDLQLLQFRAFFSGGPNSNRGYAFNEVGPHGAVPTLTGVTEGIVPTGGLSLWETSVELRIPISGNFGTTVFVDASDITRSVASFRLTRPHLSTGAGLRYATPIGPLRVDIGYRVPCVQVLGVCPGEALPADEGVPDTLLGLPVAVSVAIGEAF